ncbi:MAG TPA: MFS transporter [Fimbriimonadaceae bacterium]|nr:MFS transporter [Fimbriimonadaceae bacterium]
MHDSEPGRWGIPRRVWTLGWVSFFADTSTEIIYPIVPLFLTRVLGAPMAIVGLVEGLAEATANVFKGWSGLHSDRIGKRKPFVEWGYGLSAVGKPLLALAFAWPVVVFARVLDRFGKGLRTSARDALIADVAPKETAGKIFGMHRTMDTAGALLGVVILLGLIALLNDQYKTIFLIAFVPGVVAWYLTTRIQESSPAVSKEERKKVSWRSLPSSFWWVMVPNLVFALANSSDAFLLLRAKDLHLTDFSVVFAYMAYNITYVLVSYPAGRLSDKVGRWWLMGSSWVLYALVYVGFALTGASALWPLFLLYGIYIGISQGVSKALVADNAPKEAKGTAMGVFNLLTGFAALGASGLTGLLWDYVGFSVAFLVAAGLAVVAVALVPLAITKSRSATSVA